MKFFATLLLLPAVALASPLEVRQTALCTGTTGNAQCCAVDVLGLADLNCSNPPTQPTDNNDFIAICSAEGHTAMCCALPVLGQALICSTVNPTA